jgi:diguanylate cyclase (GGDEF)-like protein
MQHIVARSERLRQKIEFNPAATLEGKKQFFVTARIGICQVMGDNLESMMKIADEQLYKAKNAGRNRVELQAS